MAIQVGLRVAAVHEVPSIVGLPRLLPGTIRVLLLGHHAKLADQIKRLLNIKVQWLERWVNAHIVFVKALALGNLLECLN